MQPEVGRATLWLEKIARNILFASKAWGKFPTPVDKIAEFAELQIEMGINLSKVEPDFITAKFELLIDHWEMFAPREKPFLAGIHRFPEHIQFSRFYLGRIQLQATLTGASVTVRHFIRESAIQNWSSFSLNSTLNVVREP